MPLLIWNNNLREIEESHCVEALFLMFAIATGISTVYRTVLYIFPRST